MLNILLVGTAVCDFIVTSIDRLAEPSSIAYLSNDVAISIGGHPCNIAIDLVKLGRDSKYIIKYIMLLVLLLMIFVVLFT